MTQRTLTQNKALHLYLELLSEALNNAGYDMKRTLKEDIEIPWNKDMAKEFLWRPIQEIVLKKKSTTELETSDLNEIYAILDRHISAKFGVHVEFPRFDHNAPGWEIYEQCH